MAGKSRRFTASSEVREEYNTLHEFLSRAIAPFTLWAHECEDGIDWVDSESFRMAERLAGEIHHGDFDLKQYPKPLVQPGNLTADRDSP
ncbi:hypothetical protein FF011L_36760 [Roseimaritima multifibrata]|uniref:Uncharacterized protein n=1 Tax=Roseimaritima multifibrata TaxID=1930274 RepID=A0A517MJ65_9BACT|nr:hypothetical protein FF011L_36760 [Roseimaritima multifibrata]